MPIGSVLYVGAEEPNNPESVLTVDLVKPNQDYTDSIWEQLGNSFGAESREHFLWMVRGLAAFHKIEVEYSDDIQLPKDS